MSKAPTSAHLPPLKKGDRGGFRTGGRVQIPPNPSLLKLTITHIVLDYFRIESKESCSL